MNNYVSIFDDMPKDISDLSEEFKEELFKLNSLLAIITLMDIQLVTKALLAMGE